ncbi:MAG: glycosyltransferase [Fusobacteriaceae bacterium]
MKKKLISSFYDPYILGGAELSNKILAEGIKNIEVVTLGKNNIEEEVNSILVKRLNFSSVITGIFEEINGEKKSKFFKIKKIVYRLSTYTNIFKYKKIVLGNLEEKEIIHTSGINYFFPQFWWKGAKLKKSIAIHTLRDPILIYSTLKKSENKLIKIFDIFHKYYYIKYVEKYVDYIHSPTQYMIDLHIKNGFKFKNIKVIPNSVKLDFEICLYQKKKYDLVYVGSLVEHKGIKTLLNLKKNNEKLKILFIGDGDLKKDSVNNGIEVTGWLKQAEVFELIKQSKVLILPSEWEEAFGRVLIEGVACGTISIGSNMGGIPEVLFNDSRYIFEAKNVTDLKNKVERVLKLSENEYKLELLKLQKKMEIYKYENHIKQFEDFYDEVLKNRGWNK